MTADISCYGISKITRFMRNRSLLCLHRLSLSALLAIALLPTAASSAYDSNEGLARAPVTPERSVGMWASTASSPPQPSFQSRVRINIIPIKPMTYVEMPNSPVEPARGLDIIRKLRILAL
jgi:hypothetical protein